MKTLTPPSTVHASITFVLSPVCEVNTAVAAVPTPALVEYVTVGGVVTYPFPEYIILICPIPLDNANFAPVPDPVNAVKVFAPTIGLGRTPPVVIDTVDIIPPETPVTVTVIDELTLHTNVSPIVNPVPPDPPTMEALTAVYVAVAIGEIALVIGFPPVKPIVIGVVYPLPGDETLILVTPSPPTVMPGKPVTGLTPNPTAYANVPAFIEENVGYHTPSWLLFTATRTSP